MFSLPPTNFGLIFVATTTFGITPEIRIFFCLGPQQGDQKHQGRQVYPLNGWNVMKP